MSKSLQKIHHIAIEVADIQRSIDWYQEKFACEIEYQDESWGLLKFENIKLALVLPKQHPAHIAFSVSKSNISGTLSEHRDGSQSQYQQDPDGNFIELLATDT